MIASTASDQALVPVDYCTKFGCTHTRLRFGRRYFDGPAVWYCPICGASYGADAKHTDKEG